MARVFVVQDQQRISNGVKESRFDYSGAAKYGEIQFILSPTVRPFMTQNAIDKIRDRLGDYTEDDFLLLTGNPTLIGLCVAIAAQKSNIVRILQWDSMRREYVEITADL